MPPIPIPMFTLDEARLAFVTSAIELLEVVERPSTSLANYIAGVGPTSKLHPTARQVVQSHRRLLKNLDDAGHGWAIDDEIDGLTSVILDPTLGPDQALRLASRHTPVGATVERIAA